MAFVQIEDFQGSAECIVFSDQWEQYGGLLGEDEIVGIQGKIDNSRGDPKIIVEKVLSPEQMQEIERSEIHIRLAAGFTDEEELYNIRSFLIENTGESEVYLHIPLGIDSRETVVKASTQIGLSQNRAILEKLQTHAGVIEVWKE
jgi:DNA polymerase III alpha subunit